MKCSRCGNDNESNDKFCRVCGFPLTETGAPVAQPNMQPVAQPIIYPNTSPSPKKKNIVPFIIHMVIHCVMAIAIVILSINLYITKSDLEFFQDYANDLKYQNDHPVESWFDSIFE